MISSLLRPFKEIFKHPVSMLPGIGLALAISIIWYVIFNEIASFIEKVYYEDLLPQTSIAAYPFQFFSMYGIDLLILFISFLVFGILFIAVNFFYANYAAELNGKKPSAGKAFSKTLSQFEGIFAFLVFFVILGIFMLIVSWLLMMAEQAVQYFGIVFSVIIAIFIVFVWIKVGFIIPAMAINGEKLKKAIGTSWGFTNQQFWKVLVFFLILWVIIAIITGIGSAISDAILDDLIAFIIFTLFWAFSLAYYGFATAFYYLEKS